MSKKLLVKTPQTKDGTTVLQDEKGNVLYTETIVELGAKDLYKQMNNALPKKFQRVLQVVDGDDEIIIPQSLVPGNTAEMDLLKKQVADMQAMIAQLSKPAEPAKPETAPVMNQGGAGENDPSAKKTVPAASATGTKPAEDKK